MHRLRNAGRWEENLTKSSNYVLFMFSNLDLYAQGSQYIAKNCFTSLSFNVQFGNRNGKGLSRNVMKMNFINALNSQRL